VNVVHLVRDRNGRWYLRLVSTANGEVLAHSEAYFSKWNAKRAARKNYPGKELVEVTA
jgi:uncharacterized protein YegP (UPF0339 family)